MRQQFGFSHCWDNFASNREQIMEQNRADARHDQLCNWARALGLEIEEEKRVMRLPHADEEGRLVYYHLHVVIVGSEDLMHYLTQQVWNMPKW